MTKAADPTLAIAAYLKAQQAINTEVEGRVFRPELPTDEQSHMPRSCVLVRPAGGGTMFAKVDLPVTDSRLDIVCYGSTRLDSENIARECAAALKELSHSTWEKVVVFWARVAGQPASAIDPETNWPFAVTVAQVMYSTRTTS
jgi:hypothetical protein